MGWTSVARVSIVATALAVALGLSTLDRDRERCADASRAAYTVAQAPSAQLDPAVEQVVRDCPGSDPLMRISLGLLRVGREGTAERLAREAAAREPDSYFAWAVLALTEPPRQAAPAAARARSLNPIAARAAGP